MKNKILFERPGPGGELEFNSLPLAVREIDHDQDGLTKYHIRELIAKTVFKRPPGRDGGVRLLLVAKHDLWQTQLEQTLNKPPSS